MPTAVTTGDLRHRVVFKQPNSSLNDEGGEEKTFTTVITTWAKVTAFKQNRVVDADTTVLAGSLDFYIRYNSNTAEINKDWLLQYESDDYTIHLIEPIDQLKNFIRITAKARTNG
jgi:SPP1 family predicted phage head-tail adaptor